MNVHVPDRYSEAIHRLALGIEPWDVQRAARVGTRVHVDLDLGLAPPSHRAPRLDRHGSGLHALVDRPGLPDPLPVRLSDGARRFVPRRLEVAFGARPVRLRVGLFPGAAYDLPERSTGLRGRVVRGPVEDRRPVRWCRVVARMGARVVGRAHGDDRGEFLLILQPEASALGTLQSPLAVEVSVFAPLLAPSPSTPDLPALDPLWDLPVEAAPDPAGEVDLGTALPSGYVSTATSVRTVAFPLSVLKSEPEFLFSNT